MRHRGLIQRVAGIGIGFAVLQAIGGRTCTSVISGTLPPGTAHPLLANLLGVAYVVAYVGVTLVAPILILAWGLLWLQERIAPSSKPNQT